MTNILSGNFRNLICSGNQSDLCVYGVCVRVRVCVSLVFFKTFVEWDYEAKGSRPAKLKNIQNDETFQIDQFYCIARKVSQTRVLRHPFPF